MGSEMCIRDRPHSDQQARHVDLRNSEHHEKKFVKNLAMCGYYATQLFAEKQHIFENFVINTVAVVKECDNSSPFYIHNVVFRKIVVILLRIARQSAFKLVI